MPPHDEKSPGRVTAKMGRDVVKASFWIEIEGTQEQVAYVAERVAWVVKQEQGFESEPLRPSASVVEENQSND